MDEKCLKLQRLMGNCCTEASLDWWGVQLLLDTLREEAKDTGLVCTISIKEFACGVAKVAGSHETLDDKWRLVPSVFNCCVLYFWAIDEELPPRLYIYVLLLAFFSEDSFEVAITSWKGSVKEDDMISFIGWSSCSMHSSSCPRDSSNTSKGEIPWGYDGISGFQSDDISGKSRLFGNV